MADDMDVPPLEDMSSMLQKVLSSRDIKTDDVSSNRMPVVSLSRTASSDSWTSDGKILSSVSGIDHLV